jgi:hypothetical protein
LLADNRLSDIASNDDAALLAILQSIAAQDTSALLGTGFTADDMTRLLHESHPDTSPQMGALEYRVIVECNDEQHQRDVLAKLESEGMRCRALIS